MLYPEKPLKPETRHVLQRPGEPRLVSAWCPTPLYCHANRKKYAVTLAAYSGRVIVNLLFFDSKPKMKGICILQFCCLLVLLMLLEMTYKESTAGSEDDTGVEKR